MLFFLQKSRGNILEYCELGGERDKEEEKKEKRRVEIKLDLFGED